MPRFNVIFTICLLTAASQAFAQSLNKDIVCSQLVPPMLEFVGSVEDLPVQFDPVYDQLSAEDKETFSAVQARGKEMADASRAYRAAFVNACFAE